MSLGDVQAFIQYSRQFTFPIIQAASIANVLQSAVASAERVFELLDEAEEIADPVAPAAAARTRPLGRVTFEDVAFRYVADKPLIEDLDLVVEPGQTVAIVGPTGAGKTTLVNLLMRFYDVDQGRITVDGIDTRELTRDDLRRTFGMVLQDAWLFKGTIRENIVVRRRRRAVPRSAFREAVEAAHVDHFVRTLPDGYETVLDDDATNVSAGEKQLLTIARAFLADPPILILDEATSSVDTRTEVLIQRAMKRLMRGRTSFVIAHRLSTIRDADVILVMHQGRIIEQGTHDELLAASAGFYHELYASQFEEALDAGRLAHRRVCGLRSPEPRPADGDGAPGRRSRHSAPPSAGCRSRPCASPPAVEPMRRHASARTIPSADAGTRPVHLPHRSGARLTARRQSRPSRVTVARGWTRPGRIFVCRRSRAPSRSSAGRRRRPRHREHVPSLVAGFTPAAGPGARRADRCPIPRHHHARSEDTPATGPTSSPTTTTPARARSRSRAVPDAERRRSARWSSPPTATTRSRRRANFFGTASTTYNVANDKHTPAAPRSRSMSRTRRTRRSRTTTPSRSPRTRRPTSRPRSRPTTPTPTATR